MRPDRRPFFWSRNTSVFYVEISSVMTLNNISTVYFTTSPDEFFQLHRYLSTGMAKFPFSLILLGKICSIKDRSGTYFCPSILCESASIYISKQPYSKFSFSSAIQLYSYSRRSVLAYLCQSQRVLFYGFRKFFR